MTTELEQLKGAAAELDAPIAPAPPPGSEIAAPVDFHAEARDLVDFAGDMLGGLFPSVRAIWTPEARNRLTATLAPVMEKYGWTAGVLGPELMLAAVAVPMTIRTVQAVRADLARPKEPKPDAPPENGQAPVLDQTDPSSLHTRA